MILNVLLGLALVTTPIDLPSAARIAFTRLTDEYWQIWVVAPDGSHPTQVTHGSGDKRNPCWTPDGSGIIWNTPGGQLYLTESGQPPIRLLQGQSPLVDANCSSQGEIAYARVRQDPGYLLEVWTTKWDGTGRRLLTRPPHRHLQPAWDPSGSRVAVAHHIPSESRRSILVLKGREESQAWFQCADLLTTPTWSPDGDRIAFGRDFKGNHDIWMVGENESSLVRLTYHPGLDTHPSFSPRGDDLVFVSGRSGSSQLWSVPVDGGTPRRVTKGDAPCREPAWWIPPANDEPVLQDVVVHHLSERGGLEGKAAVVFQLAARADCKLMVSDASGSEVTTVELRGETGPNVIHWDGQVKGTPAAPGLYFLRLEVKGDSVAVWDPTWTSGGEKLTVEELALVDPERSFSFRLPKPAILRVRTGVARGALFHTPVNWAVFEPGEVQIPYPGELSPGWGDYWERPDRHVTVAGMTLPENAVVLAGVRGDIPVARWEIPLPQATASSDSHASHPPELCSDVTLVGEIESERRNDEGLPIVEGRFAVRIDGVSQQDRKTMSESPFEVMIYLDGQFLLEDEDSALPYNYDLELPDLPEGTHSLLVNVGGWDDHMGAVFIPFVVEIEAR